MVVYGSIVLPNVLRMRPGLSWIVDAVVEHTISPSFVGAIGVLMGVVSFMPMLDHSGLIEFRD